MARRLAFGLAACVLFCAGCGGKARSGGERMITAGSSGMASSSSGYGGSLNGRPGNAGAAGHAESSGSGGSSGAVLCECSDQASECRARAASYCPFENASCPPTLEDALHHMQDRTSLWGGRYTECADGTRFFDWSDTYEGGFHLGFDAAGHLLFATGGSNNQTAPLCGNATDYPSGATSCRACQVEREGGLVEVGEGGAPGEAGAGGNSAGTSSIPYCFVDASGGLVMPGD